MRIILFMLLIGLTIGFVMIASKVGGANPKPLQAGQKNFVHFAEFFEIYKKFYKRSRHKITKDLEEIIQTTHSLITRVSETGTPLQITQATDHCEYLFEKLNKAIGPTYYLEIVNHPQYWEDPRNLSREIEMAVSSVKEELNRNMRRFNSSKDLDFKVTLKSLNNTVDDNILSKIYNKQIEGEK